MIVQKLKILQYSADYNSIYIVKRYLTSIWTWKQNTKQRHSLHFDIKKTDQSAISNAENTYQYDIDNLYITEAYVGKSLVLKRFRARAKGRASGIKKPYTNITIILSEKINNKKEIHGTKS